MPDGAQKSNDLIYQVRICDSEKEKGITDYGTLWCVRTDETTRKGCTHLCYHCFLSVKLAAYMVPTFVLRILCYFVYCYFFCEPFVTKLKTEEGEDWL